MNEWFVISKGGLFGIEVKFDFTSADSALMWARSNLRCDNFIGVYEGDRETLTTYFESIIRVSRGQHLEVGAGGGA